MLPDHQVQTGENESRVCWLVRKRLIDIAGDTNYLLQGVSAWWDQLKYRVNNNDDLSLNVYQAGGPAHYRVSCVVCQHVKYRVNLGDSDEL